MSLSSFKSRPVTNLFCDSFSNVHESCLINKKEKLIQEEDTL